MTPFHDEVFLEIDSARKLVAEFKRRPHQGADGTPGPVAHDAAAVTAPLEEDARMDDAAVDQTGANEKLTDQSNDRLEASEVLRELAEARAKERAAAEESIRKASEQQHIASDANPVRYFWFPGIGASHVWYFTAGNERCGPVTFKDLRKMAASRVLDPRLDMVWKKGMPEWKHAGIVDGLFERNLAQEEVATAPVWRTAPVKFLRSSALMEKLTSKSLLWPGVNRRVLLLGVLLFPLLWNQLISFASPFLVLMLGKNLIESLHPLLIIVPPLVLAGLLLNRLTNVGMNRWWSLAIMVPLLNLWVAFHCLFCPAGYSYHRKMDRSGLAMIVTFFLLAPFVWQSMIRHPAVAYCAYLQTGIHTLVERAGEIARPWL